MAPQFINYKTESVKVDDTEIISLKDNNNTEGKFFLGSGQIQNETYYYYMSENSKGFEMNKAIASSSFINESKEGESSVETYELRPKSKLLMWMYGPFLNVENEYIFYIPENSIDRSFEVDMK